MSASTALAALKVDVESRRGSGAPSRAAVTRWAAAALGRRGAGRELAVRIVAPGESRRLNAAYRGKDQPTNVLSFPVARLATGGAQPLGDLVVCAAVVREEAREQNKPVRAHWAHLIVHGALHLIGYDHEDDADAARMERREVAVLRRLGYSNPYRSTR